MTTKLRRTTLAVSSTVLALLASVIPIAAQSSHYNLRMENNTGYDIYQALLSSLSDGSWERDLLGHRAFEDGTSFTITEISPVLYDFKVVDQDGVTCLVTTWTFIAASIGTCR